MPRIAVEDNNRMSLRIRSEEKALFPIRNGARVYMMGMGKNEQGHSIIEWCLSWVPKHPTVFSFCVDHNK